MPPSTRSKTSTKTPMMIQYERVKSKYPDNIVLFRMGDFYEAFGEDAKIISRELGLTLSTCDKSVPMCGFPYHSLQGHLKKLIASKRKVAVSVYDPSDKEEVFREKEPKIKSSKPEFIFKNIKLLIHGDETVWVPAKVLCGMLAVNKDRKRKHEYTVTHIGTGMTIISSLPEESVLLRIAQTLVEECGDVWGETDPKKLRDSLPKWVQPWLRLQRKNKAWSAPTKEERLEK